MKNLKNSERNSRHLTPNRNQTTIKNTAGDAWA